MNILTIEHADGSRRTTVSDWCSVDIAIIGRLKRNPDADKYIYDGLAFGVLWRDTIDTVYHIIAWQHMPKAFIGLVDFKEKEE